MSELVMTRSGIETWYECGILHRLDGPAIIYPNWHVDGYKAWYVNGKRHRLDGPSFEWDDGTMWWHIEGVQYFNFKSFQAAGKLTDDQMTILKLKYGGEMGDE
jgi:hypothetical protein